jgi:rhodanese-related sulfurtransferase
MGWRGVSARGQECGQVRRHRVISRRALGGLLLLALCVPAALAQAPTPPASEPDGLVGGKWAWEPSRKIRKFTPQQVLALVFSPVKGGPILIDARGPQEYARGHIPSAINVPHKETWGRAPKLLQYDERGIIYYGLVDTRAEVGTKGLRGEGFRRLGRMLGGFREWQRLGYPVER